MIVLIMVTMTTVLLSSECHAFVKFSSQAKLSQEVSSSLSLLLLSVFSHAVSLFPPCDISCLVTSYLANQEMKLVRRLSDSCCLSARQRINPDSGGETFPIPGLTLPLQRQCVCVLSIRLEIYHLVAVQGGSSLHENHFMMVSRQNVSLLTQSCN